MSLLAQNITKEFSLPRGQVFRALDDVSLTFTRGKFHTLLGPSGCGKTTLLRIIAGFETATRGQITWHGNRINEVPPHQRGFPMVFQSYALFPHMTVNENIAYGLKIRKVSKKDISTRVSRIVSLLQLDVHQNKFPSQLSGGQQQRVALARALVLEPEVILFDEPLSNLDAKLRLTMRDEIRALQKRLGITAIYVTHDQEEAMAISDQIVVMNKGVVEQIGAPVEIYHRPASEFVADFVGAANILDLDFVEDFKADKNAQKVVIRPEAITLSKSSGKRRAVVESSIFLGSRYQYTLNCGEGVRISLDYPSSDNEEVFSPGEQVTYDVNPEKLHFLNN